MKLIIAGSRTIRSYVDVLMACNEAFRLWDVFIPGTMIATVLVSEVVSGGARGADALGERWAHTRGIPVKRFPADWSKYGDRAGPLRNRAMAEYVFEHSAPWRPGGLVAVWDGRSRGTLNMIDTARALGLRVHVKRVLNLKLPPGWNERRGL